MSVDKRWRLNWLKTLIKKINFVDVCSFSGTSRPWINAAVALLFFSRIGFSPWCPTCISCTIMIGSRRRHPNHQGHQGHQGQGQVLGHRWSPTMPTAVTHRPWSASTPLRRSRLAEICRQQQKVTTTNHFRHHT